MTFDEELIAVEHVVQAGLDAATEHLERMAGVAHWDEITIAGYKDYLDTTIALTNSMLTLCRRFVSTRGGSDTPSADDSRRTVEGLVAIVLESLKTMYLAMNVIEQMAAVGGHHSSQNVPEHPKESRGTRDCSFCGKSDTETKVVAGPAGNICASCTRLACAVLGIPLQEKSAE